MWSVCESFGHRTTTSCAEVAKLIAGRLMWAKGTVHQIGPDPLIERNTCEGQCCSWDICRPIIINVPVDYCLLLFTMSTGHCLPIQYVRQINAFTTTVTGANCSYE